MHFPRPGNELASHDRWTPAQAGLDPALATRINRYLRENPYVLRKVVPRWALWRHGHLVQVEGDFLEKADVASLRKTWHAMIVGAAIKQGRIASLDEKISKWLPELTGNDAEATWRHVITQSAGFDYPYGDYPDFKPGEMWTYSDWNLVHLCTALARVFGKKGYEDNYADVAARAYFDAIGLTGWQTRIVPDKGFVHRPNDGVRFVFNLEHMGRLGLFALARGSWNGVELVPRWFVEALETKQTRGMRVNYEGPNDGRVGPARRQQEAPYGFLTWVNTDGDLFPGADRAWAFGLGAGGSAVVWNHRNGIVFAGFGIREATTRDNLPRVLDAIIAPP